MYVMLSYIRRERIVRGPRIGRKSSFVTSIFLMMMSGRWMDYSQVHLFNRGGLCRRYNAVHSAQWVVFCFFPLFNDVTKREKCNKGAQKMSLFTTLHWWNFEVMIHATSVVKKVHFSSTSMVIAKNRWLYNKNHSCQNISIIKVVLLFLNSSMKKQTKRFGWFLT